MIGVTTAVCEYDDIGGHEEMTASDRDVRFDGRELRLDRYGVSGLADILEARARLGLAPNSVDRDAPETIADEAAAVARVGIQALREAAVLAEERGHSRIQEGDVADSFERARRRVREQALRSLPFYYQVLYELVREAGEIDGEALHQRYEGIVDEVYAGRAQTPISKRGRQYKLEKLSEYGLVKRLDTGYETVDESLYSDLELRVVSRANSSR